jgi:hypothetical protein
MKASCKYRSMIPPPNYTNAPCSSDPMLIDEIKLTSSSENQCEITHTDYDEGEVLDVPGTRRHDMGNAGTVQKRRRF